MGLEGVLTQKDDSGREYVFAYASQSNNTAKANYSSYEGEALAAVWAIAHFRPYLYDQQFTLVTDHQPLRWLMESDKLTGKLVRWAMLIQEYDFEVVHRAGMQNDCQDGCRWTLTQSKSFDDEIDRPQAIADIWNNPPVLHKLQQGTFPLSISAMERDRIGHQITRFP